MQATITDDPLVRHQQTLYRSKNPTRRWLHCTRRDWIMGAIRQAALSGQRDSALEIGPGSGVYLPLLAELFDSVTGGDIEEAYLDNARALLAKHPNLQLVVQDITQPTLPQRSFDLILCSEVVEHIADSRPAIASMYRLLRPGGTLILSTPQRFSPLEQTAKIAFLPGVINVVRWIYGESVLHTEHINLMTQRTVTRQLQAAGFDIIRRHKTGMYLPFVAEFFGGFGQRVLARLESTLRGGTMDWLLWEQYYVAKRGDEQA